MDDYFLERDKYEGNPNNTIENRVKKYVRHPSVLKIKEYITTENAFSFSLTTTQQFEIEIQQLDPKKASAENDIPTKVLIETSDAASHYLPKICNNSKKDHIFPESLKLADVIPMHKNDERTNKENYRPVSLLPITSKLFERDMYKQIHRYTDKYLSPYLFGFRKGHSTEQCLTVMLEQ